MIKITCCRAGRTWRCNRKHKGEFVKEFSSIADLAEYMHRSKHTIFFPRILTELTKQQRGILAIKLEAVYAKHKIGT